MRKRLAAVGLGLILSCGLAFAGAAWAAPKKAVFYDTSIKPNWFTDGENLSKYLEDAGYDTLDSDDVAKFMTQRIADKQPSVVVFAIDRAPTTIVPKATKKCILRDYLDAGGKVVWLGDIPLYTIQDPSATDGITISDGGGAMVLTTPTVYKYDLNLTCEVTELGKKWGLDETWDSQRTVRIFKAQSATVSSLADVEGGLSAAWVKNYGGPEGTGFVRLWDRNGNAPSDYSWVQAVAEYGLK